MLSFSRISPVSEATLTSTGERAGNVGIPQARSEISSYMTSLKALCYIIQHLPVLVCLSQSLAAKVIGSNDGSQFRLFLESRQVVSHPRPVT